MGFNINKKQLEYDSKHLSDLQFVLKYMNANLKYRPSLKTKLITGSLIASEILGIFGINALASEVDKTSLETPNTSIEQVIDTPSPIINTNPAPIIVNPVENPIINQVEANNVDMSFFEEQQINSICFTLSTDDRSNDAEWNETRTRYGLLIDYYANMYGIDSLLLTAIVAQENVNDQYDSSGYSHGLTQITNVWKDVTLNNYIFTENGITEETETINLNNIDNNRNVAFGNGEYGNVTLGQAYSLKYGCMILQYYYNKYNKEFDGKYTPEELIIATLYAYNHGETEARKKMNYYDSFEELGYAFEYYASNGDGEYINNVCRRIPNNTPIYMTTSDGIKNYISFDKDPSISCIRENSNSLVR